MRVSPKIPIRHTALAACLLLFAVVGLLVQFSVRLDYGPDEPDHMEYVHVLAWDHRLPTPGETHLVQHPPLPYVAMAAIWHAANASQEPARLRPGPGALTQMTSHAVLGRRLLRFFSTLMACLTLLILAYILTTLEVPQAWRLVILLLIAAVPMVQYVSAVVTNENWSILYSSVICLAIVRRVKSGECTPQQALWLGVLIGGGTAIKQTTLFAVPLALWTVWAVGRREGKWIRAGLFLAGMPMLGLWWPLHNRLTAGQWFPCYTIPDGQEKIAANALHHPWVLGGWLRNILETSFLPDWSALFVPRFLSTLAFLVLIFGIGSLFAWGTRDRRDAVNRRLRGLSIGGLLLLTTGILEYSLVSDYRAQIGGRYLLNGLPWLVTLLGASLPLLGLRLRQTPPLGAALPVVILFLFDAGWWYIVQGYYSSPHFGQ